VNWYWHRRHNHRCLPRACPDFTTRTLPQRGQKGRSCTPTHQAYQLPAPVYKTHRYIVKPSACPSGDVALILSAGAIHCFAMLQLCFLLIDRHIS
jgi:hypothetical protein